MSCNSQEEIQLCLNCKRPSCNNCLGGGTFSETKVAERLEKIAPYLRGELSAKEMARQLGVSRDTVYDWANKYGGRK